MCSLCLRVRFPHTPTLTLTLTLTPTPTSTSSSPLLALTQVSFSVPTGNFGDIFAGYLAHKMGLPIARLVIATNQNDILHRCLSDNDHSTRALEQSLAPSMDILISSNFERLLFDLYNRDGEAIAALMKDAKAGHMILSDSALCEARKLFSSHRCDDAGMLRIIGEVSRECGYLLDPHTAIGLEAARQCSKFSSSRSRLSDKEEDTKDMKDTHTHTHTHTTPMVILATAHPAKFPEAAHKAGIVPPHTPMLPAHMADLFDREERFTVLANDLEEVHQYMALHIV